MTIRTSFRRLSFTLLPVFMALAVPAAAQTSLTLADAIRQATERSEALDIARAGEARADADAIRARSQRLPQLSFTGSYSRTLASEFSGAFSSSAPACAPLTVDASKALTDRVAELERAAACGAIGGTSFSGLSKLPFGQKNVYQGAFAFSQALYAGGRITAQQAQAEASRRLATFVTSSTEAQVALDVTRAFFDAALSDRLVAIAELGLQQAAAAYEQTRLAFDAGRQPEFELLRAQVARDNQRPIVIRRRADRDIAYLRLRQLLKMPREAPLSLDVNLETPALAAPEPFAESLAAARAAGPTASDRLVVRQAEIAVELREAAVTVARAERLPSASLTSSLARVGYPSDGVLPGIGDFRTNWSLGAAVQVPIFNGQRLKADELTARADLASAKSELQQSREMAVLETATSLEDLAAAEAVWEASAGTVQQAQRAYEIAELRNREGLSTQLELSDSRLSLQIAQANRAQAAHDLQIARARAALLPKLPAGAR